MASGLFPFLGQDISDIINDITQYIMIVSFPAAGFFHALAIHFSLFYVYKKKKRQSDAIPLQNRLASPESSTLLCEPNRKDINRPEMVHLFTGQVRTSQQQDTIDLIKA
ncbi:hypothetical protein HDV01_005957 [Terramyces sp. JEL0728]|nr:hypothetical protein HDV01_005957 [Terramyces sp. JEL0728]